MVTTYPTIHVIVLVASRMKRLPVVSNEDADMLQMIGNYLLCFSRTCKKKKKKKADANWKQNICLQSKSCAHWCCHVSRCRILLSVSNLRCFITAQRVVDSKLYYNKVEQLVRTVTQLCHS